MHILDRFILAILNLPSSAMAVPSGRSRYANYAVTSRETPLKMEIIAVDHSYKLMVNVKNASI
jgi:hypothetical protein